MNLRIKLIDLPIEEARRWKWEAGAKEHGSVMVEDPLEGMLLEALDWLNYCREALADPDGRLSVSARASLQSSLNIMEGVANTVRLICGATAKPYVPRTAIYHPKE